MGDMDTTGPGTKRKPSAQEMDGQPSPSQRQATGLTLEAFSQLLAAQTAAQTKELQASTSKQITEAVEALEKKTMARMDKVEKGLKGYLKKMEDKVGAVRIDVEDLAKRVAALETRPPGSSDGSTMSGDTRLAVIVGGWRRDTQKHLIEGDFKVLLADLDVAKFMDGEWFVPGRRASVAIVPIVVRRDETPDRMMEMVETIRSAKMQTENLMGEATVWAALSKPRHQRLNASHAGKLRRLIWSLKLDARTADCEYSSGSVWMREHLLGSVTRRPPSHGTIEKGTVEDSWVDIAAVAKIATVAQNVVKETWEACLAN